MALGIRIPITYDISLTAEVKRQWAETEMNDDFFQNRLDLTGNERDARVQGPLLRALRRNETDRLGSGD